MNNDMNFEFELKNCFNEEAPELPDSLKKEKVIEMLEKNKTETAIKKKKHVFPKVIAVAAALMITLAAVYTLPLMLPEKGLVEATTVPATSKETTENENIQQKPQIIDNGIKASKLMQAESTEALKAHFARVYRESMVDDVFDSAADIIGDSVESFVGGFKGTDGAVDEYYYADAEAPAAPAEPELAPEADYEIQEAPVAPGAQNGSAETMATTAAAAADSKTEVSFGKTNTQVENVDEADIIKNDGKYLYILAGGAHKVERRVSIVNAENMKVSSYIELKDDRYYHNIQEMYVNGDRLVLLCTENEKKYDEYADNYYNIYYTGNVVSFVFDISDRENPTFVRKVTQDGQNYISSRMIEGVLYTVSSYRVIGDSEEEIKKNAVPQVNGKEITCDCIYIYDYDSEQYIIVTAYDTKSDDGTVTSLSILGSGDEVYCSKDALYVSGRVYEQDMDYTEIYSFSLDGTDIAYKASGAVKGTVLNQFSLDEYKENLRIATTYYSYKHDVDVSNIYVLNKDLELIGALEDIAYDEQVKSVRFMGDTGFVVTFRNTDPLFTLDLSDPTAPETVGEVKLPGFSSYLHPVGDGLVVGLGYDGDEENADFSSLKVSLFDVSDMKNPEEVDTFVLKDVSSEALYNPKSFIYYPEENLIGFPVQHYDSRTVLSYKLLKIENGKISNHLGYVHETERMTGDVFRGTYIGQLLYTIDNYNVCEFDIATAEMTRSCEILDVEDDIPEGDEYYYDDVITSAFTPERASTMDDVDVVAETSVDVTTSSELKVTTTNAVTEMTTQSYTMTEPAGLTFEAKVVEVLENSLLIEVTEKGSSLLSTGTEAYISVDDGNAYSVGDELKITFDGVVQETYPVKIPNVLGIGVSKE